MKKKDSKRQQQTIPKNPSGSTEGSSEDFKKLRYDLNEHQVELKAQNEELQRAHLELSRTHDRYKELFDSAPIGYLVLDGSFMIREANLMAASLLGTPHKDLIGTPLSKFMDRREADAYYLHLTEALDKGTQRGCELVFRPAIGPLFHTHLETSPYEDSRFGKGWRIALVEITERRKTEEALRRNEARFRLLSDTAGRLLATDDPQGLVKELCTDVMKHLDCQAFFNFIVDERAGRLKLNACAGIPEEEVWKLEWLDYGVAVCGCVARDAARIIAEDIFHTPDARTELVRSYGIQAYCCHPLKGQARLIGTLSFGTKTRTHFTPEEVELMRIVADQVAVAMQRIQAQQEIVESNQRLQLALDAGGMGMWALDLRTNRAAWNPKEYELLGLPASDGVVDAEEFFRYVHPEDAPDLRESLRGVIARGSMSMREFRIVRNDGQIRWLASVGRVMRAESGQPLSIIGINYDVTERKEWEAELGKLNRTLRALSNSSRALMRAEEETAYLKEICQIVIRDCGYAMVWIGYAEHDEAKTIRPVVHAGFEDGYLETLNLTWADTERGRGPGGTAIRTGKPSMCTDMLNDSRFAPWRDQALKRGYASSLVLPLLTDGAAFGEITIYSKNPNPFSEDEVNLLTELANDLTHGITTLRLRQQNWLALMALCESEERFRQLADAMPQLVWTAAPDGRVDYFNQRLKEFKSVEQRSPVIHPKDLPRTMKVWQRGIKSGKDYEIEHRLQLADGSFRWFLSRAVPIRDEVGSVIKWFATSTDVDDRKQAEQALQQSRDEMEAKVHERTAELTLLLEDLQKSRDDLRKLASELVMAEERERKSIAVTLHDEVAQTLAAAKMRLDLLKNMQGSDEAPQVIDAVGELLQQSIKETRGLMTDISSPILYDMGLPSAVQHLAEQASALYGLAVSHSATGDFGGLEQELSVMIYQAVRELLHNVVKHSQARNANVRIIEEESGIRTIVADDGQGFDVNKIGSPGQEGGFGLFSLRERVKSFHGGMQIESKPGKGTVVTIMLPSSSGKAKETQDKEKTSPKGRRKRKT